MKKSFAIILTVINVGAALVATVCLGYFLGYKQGSRGVVPQAPGHPANVVVPNPHVGQGQHPPFDCSKVVRPLGPPKDGLTDLKTLGENRSDLDGDTVAVRGLVVEAYPQIMGTNWFHVCDRPNGEVLVVSGQAWVEPGNEVEVRGRLSLNRNIGNAYVFPLYIEDGLIQGENVKQGRGEGATPIQLL